MNITRFVLDNQCLSLDYALESVKEHWNISQVISCERLDKPNLYLVTVEDNGQYIPAEISFYSSVMLYSD